MAQYDGWWAANAVSTMVEMFTLIIALIEQEKPRQPIRSTEKSITGCAVPVMDIKAPI